MKRTHLWLALALLVVVNVFVLVGVAYNRSGRPDAEATLTERELPLRIDYRGEDNSGLSLRLNWKNDFVADWFDAAKLAALGFAPRTDEKAPARSDLFYRHMLPKRVFVVLEYQGAAWQRFQKQKEDELAKLKEESPKTKNEESLLKSRQQRIENELQNSSRLFAVDAGLDPGELRSRYPDRGRDLIVPALVRMSYGSKDRKIVARGFIVKILSDDLHLSRDLAARLLALPGMKRSGRRFSYPGFAENTPPRYEATVRWGRRHEPWVVGVTVYGGKQAG